MKCDMDLIRKILIMVEDNVGEPIINPDIAGYDSDNVGYQVCLLLEAELIKGDIDETCDGHFGAVVLYRLTWEGHQFLASIKNDNVWRKVKKNVFSKAKSLPFDVVRTIALKMIEESLGLL